MKKDICVRCKKYFAKNLKEDKQNNKGYYECKYCNLKFWKSIKNQK